MQRLSDGRHGVRQAIQPPGVHTQTAVRHVSAKHKEAHQFQGWDAESGLRAGGQPER